jgi:two-component system sensor histidine kinase BaeS
MAGDAPRGAFGRRLAVAFAAVAALTALLAGVLLSAAWNYQFNNYIRTNLAHTASAWATLVAQGYSENGGWAGGWLNNLPRFAPTRTYALEIVAISETTGLDTLLLYDDGLGNTRVFAPDTGSPLPGEWVQAPIIVADRTVGAVLVRSIGTSTVLSEIDAQFRSGSLVALLIAVVVGASLASAGGLWYATRLVRPINRITETAEELRRGNADARTGMQGEDEIGFLARTLDEMADSIEADRNMERQLTADVAHELRTPLQAIQAMVEAMQDGVLPADEEHLGVVRDETLRLSRLTNAILELTRLERGAVPFTMHRIDLSEPVRAAVETHRPLFDTCELALSVDLADEVWIRGDADKLQQAIGNLLSNAARYTPEGGRVEVSLRKEARQAVVSVADTGIGVEEENLDRVFQRFWRADDARHRSSGGLGIGLAVVREIVERHGGSIGVSRRSGGGSVFSVRLPLAT